MKFTKVENPEELKNKIVRNYTIQGSLLSRRWMKAVNSQYNRTKDIVWVELSQSNVGERRDREYYFLLIMPKKVYAIYSSDFDAEKKIHFGIFEGTVSFQEYDRVYIEEIINDASLAMGGWKFEMEQKKRGWWA